MSIHKRKFKMLICLDQSGLHYLKLKQDEYKLYIYIYIYIYIYH